MKSLCHGSTASTAIANEKPLLKTVILLDSYCDRVALLCYPTILRIINYNVMSILKALTLQPKLQS